MTGPYKPEPIMGCTADQYDEVYSLACNVRDNGMYAHLTEFPAIPEAADKFDTDAVKLGELIVSAKGNTQNREDRDAQSIVVHDKLANNLLYAKNICKNDIHLIHISGYPVSAIPEPAQLPETREIKDIVKGKEYGTIKFKLQPATGSAKSRKQQKTYIIKVFATADAVEFTIGCSTTNSRKLIAKNVPVDVARYYKLVIQNTAGINELSSKVKYTLMY